MEEKSGSEELLKQLEVLKKELVRKERKLKKLERRAKAKQHVQKKIEEGNKALRETANDAVTLKTRVVTVCSPAVSPQTVSTKNVEDMELKDEKLGESKFIMEWMSVDKRKQNSSCAQRDIVKTNQRGLNVKQQYDIKPGNYISYESKPVSNKEQYFSQVSSTYIISGNKRDNVLEIKDNHPTLSVSPSGEFYGKQGYVSSQFISSILEKPSKWCDVSRKEEELEEESLKAHNDIMLQEHLDKDTLNFYSETKAWDCTDSSKTERRDVMCHATIKEEPDVCCKTKVHPNKCVVGVDNNEINTKLSISSCTENSFDSQMCLVDEMDPECDILQTDKNCTKFCLPVDLKDQNHDAGIYCKCTVQHSIVTDIHNVNIDTKHPGSNTSKTKTGTDADIGSLSPDNGIYDVRTSQQDSYTDFYDVDIGPLNLDNGIRIKTSQHNPYTEFHDVDICSVIPDTDIRDVNIGSLNLETDICDTDIGSLNLDTSIYDVDIGSLNPDTDTHDVNGLLNPNTDIFDIDIGPLNLDTSIHDVDIGPLNPDNGIRDADIGPSNLDTSIHDVDIDLSNPDIDIHSVKSDQQNPNLSISSSAADHLKLSAVIHHSIDGHTKTDSPGYNNGIAQQKSDVDTVSQHQYVNDVSIDKIFQYSGGDIKQMSSDVNSFEMKRKSRELTKLLTTSPVSGNKYVNRSLSAGNNNRKLNILEESAEKTHVENGVKSEDLCGQTVLSETILKTNMHDVKENQFLNSYCKKEKQQSLATFMSLSKSNCIPLLDTSVNIPHGEIFSWGGKQQRVDNLYSDSSCPSRSNNTESLLNRRSPRLHQNQMDSHLHNKSFSPCRKLYSSRSMFPYIPNTRGTSTKEIKMKNLKIHKNLRRVSKVHPFFRKLVKDTRFEPVTDFVLPDSEFSVLKLRVVKEKLSLQKPVPLGCSFTSSFYNVEKGESVESNKITLSTSQKEMKLTAVPTEQFQKSTQKTQYDESRESTLYNENIDSELLQDSREPTSEKLLKDDCIVSLVKNKCSETSKKDVVSENEYCYDRDMLSTVTNQQQRVIVDKEKVTELSEKCESKNVLIQMNKISPILQKDKIAVDASHGQDNHGRKGLEENEIIVHTINGDAKEIHKLAVISNSKPEPCVKYNSCTHSGNSSVTSLYKSCTGSGDSPVTNLHNSCTCSGDAPVTSHMTPGCDVVDSLKLLQSLRTSVTEPVRRIHVVEDESSVIVSCHDSVVQVWIQASDDQWIAFSSVCAGTDTKIHNSCLISSSSELWIPLFCVSDRWFVKLIGFDRKTGCVSRSFWDISDNSSTCMNLLCCGLRDLFFASSSDTNGISDVQVHTVSGHVLQQTELLMTRCLGEVEPMLSCLLDIDQLEGALLGVTEDKIFVWNYLTFSLIKVIEPHMVLAATKILWAADEKGLLYLLTGLKNKKCVTKCGLSVLNPSTGKACDLLTYTFPDSLETTELKLFSSSVSTPHYHFAVAQHNELMIWDMFSGTLAAHARLNDVSCVHLASLKPVERHCLVGLMCGCIQIFGLGHKYCSTDLSKLKS
ncbi:uncharacterized protein LOC143238327 [Tachypleus tridentatus]|uniref:uncharacterized protein LOC143238327 n=1 Tax=Tachypleus tridentatus TaxID=6853 RepID=UPI003FCFDC9C